MDEQRIGSIKYLHHRKNRFKVFLFQQSNFHMHLSFSASITEKGATSKKKGRALSRLDLSGYNTRQRGKKMISVLCQKLFRIHCIPIQGNAEVNMVPDGIFHHSGFAHGANHLTGCDDLTGGHFGFRVQAGITGGVIIFVTNDHRCTQ